LRQAGFVRKLSAPISRWHGPPTQGKGIARWYGAGSLLALVVAALLLGSGVSWHDRRSAELLNRQLIAALVMADTTRAIDLVQAGADPDTQFERPGALSVQQLCDQLLHRSAVHANSSPTALLIACGATWYEGCPYVPEQRWPDAPQLVEAMITHGAHVNVRDRFGTTPLGWASRSNWPNQTLVLLTHGADVNVKDEWENTPLSLAAMFGRAPLNSPIACAWSRGQREKQRRFNRVGPRCTAFGGSN